MLLLSLVAPSLCKQAGAVKVHRQALELEKSQERVEAVFVLKARLPPLVLLLVSLPPPRRNARQATSET